MTEVLISKPYEDIDAQKKKKAREHGGRDWSDAAKSQGTQHQGLPAVTRSQEGSTGQIPSRAFRGSRALLTG